MGGYESEDECCGQKETPAWRFKSSNLFRFSKDKLARSHWTIALPPAQNYPTSSFAPAFFVLCSVQVSVITVLCASIHIHILLLFLCHELTAGYVLFSMLFMLVHTILFYKTKVNKPRAQPMDQFSFKWKLGLAIPHCTLFFASLHFFFQHLLDCVPYGMFCCCTLWRSAAFCCIVHVCEV